MKHLMTTLLASLVLSCALMARPACAADMPGDSVYQLAVPLTDQDGHAATFGVHRGAPQIISMFYTSCTMVCPMIIETMKLTRRAAGDPANLHLLAVSFDPAHDSVDALRRYAGVHKLDLRWWTLARTTPQDTRALAAVLGVQYRPLPDGGFNHSSTLLLLDRDGRIAARSTVIGRIDPAFVDAVRQMSSETP